VQLFLNYYVVIKAADSNCSTPSSLEGSAGEIGQVLKIYLEASDQLIYTAILEAGAGEIGQVLRICLEESDRGAGPVLFHCQKGKERNGIVAMLLGQQGERTSGWNE